MFGHGPWHHGRWGGWWGGGAGGPFGVMRGDFRFLVLLALAEKPMHGYALIQELAQTYQRPVSAGLVYPTLQELEDRGHVRSKEEDGKRVYSITPEGRKYLKENEDTVSRLKTGRRHADRVGRFGLLEDMKDIGQIVWFNLDSLDDGKIQRISDEVAEAKKKIAAIVFE